MQCTSRKIIGLFRYFSCYLQAAPEKTLAVYGCDTVTMKTFLDGPPVAIDAAKKWSANKSMIDSYIDEHHAIIDRYNNSSSHR
jgi:hypothetical protein